MWNAGVRFFRAGSFDGGGCAMKRAKCRVQVFIKSTSNERLLMDGLRLVRGLKKQEAANACNEKAEKATTAANCEDLREERAP